jgi:hypothetical protein
MPPAGQRFRVACFKHFVLKTLAAPQFRNIDEQPLKFLLPLTKTLTQAAL